MRREYRVESNSLELSIGSKKFKIKQNLSVLCHTSIPGNNLHFHLSHVSLCTSTVLAWLFRGKRQDHALPSFLEKMISIFSIHSTGCLVFLEQCGRCQNIVCYCNTRQKKRGTAMTANNQQKKKTLQKNL